MFFTFTPESPFTATERSSRVSRALYNSPMPPAPSGERISYGPSLSPLLRGITFPLFYPKTRNALKGFIHPDFARWSRECCNPLVFAISGNEPICIPHSITMNDQTLSLNIKHPIFGNPGTCIQPRLGG